MRLPVISDIDLNNKVVLIRVDHNVVKKGKIKDAFRLERSKKTIAYVLEKKGFPVLMSHFGRPRDKKNNEIKIDEDENCIPIIEYMEKEWNLNVRYADVETKDAPKSGLKEIPKTALEAIEEMKQGKADIVYLPNTRWFEGEENEDAREDVSEQLA